MTAHNHGPEEGLGLACPERHVNGTQVGVCVLTSGASILAAAGLGNISGERMTTTHDPVNHPQHYTTHPSGVECIQVTRWMNFNLGNATKYIWRAGLKGDAIEDLRKAAFYIADEIARLEAQR